MSRRQLVGAAEWFALITAGAPSPLLMMQDSRVLAANPAAARLFGKEWEFELVGLEWQSLIKTAQAERINGLLLAPALDTSALATEAEIQSPRGVQFVNLHAWTGQIDASQRMLFLRVMPEEDSLVQTRLGQIDRDLRLLGLVLEAVHNMQSETALLNEVCRICVEEAGYRLAWIGLAEDHPGRPIRPVAQAGLEPGHFQDLRFSWGEGNPHGEGPSGTAIRSGAPCVMIDLLANPRYAPWRSAAERCGYSRSIALPLLVSEGERGVLTICDDSPLSFEPEELPLLKQLAATLTFGLNLARAERSRKEAGEELRAAKEFLGGLLDNAPMPIVASAVDGRILIVNKAWRELFNVHAPLGPASRISDFLDPGYVDLIQAANREVIATGQPLTVEAVVPVGSTRRRIMNRRFPLHDAEGRITAIGGIQEDITERHRMLSALRQSERNLREAERIAGMGHWIYDIPKQAGIWSEGMYHLFECDPDDPEAPNVSNFANRLLHPGDRDRVLACLTAAAETQTPYDVRYRIRRRGGGYKHIHARGLVTRLDSQGRALRMVGTCLDITSQVEAEDRLGQVNEELVQINEELRVSNEDLSRASAALGESEERYRSLVELSPDGIALVIDGKVAFCNDALVRIHGASGPAELVGRPLLSLVPGSEHAKVREVLGQVGVAGQVSPLVQSRLVRMDGSEVEAEVRLGLINWQGRLALLSVLRDITARVNLEKQVRQAQKMEAIGTLASGIAHDFNNLLFGILGYADLLREPLAGNGQALEDLDELCKAGLRAKDLVQQILVVSRRTEIKRAPLSVTSITKEALRLLRSSLPATIEIAQRLEGADLLVEADPTEVHQVVMNLCTNAAQAMPAGGRLEVSTRSFVVDDEFAAAHPGLKSGHHLLLQVSDTGEGMTPEVLERIFEPFFTTKPAGEGTGLGLSVVYGIVAAMGGSISAYSRTGQGSTFNTYLPLCSGVEWSATPPPASLEIRGDERIMVVDDDEGLMKLVARSLGKLGYSVSGFTDSTVALNAFRANPDGFDLLYTDYTMPGLTGMHLTNAVRTLRPRLPVILATGFVHEGLEDAAIFAGIREIVTKPATTSSLGAVIRRALDEAKAPA